MLTVNEMCGRRLPPPETVSQSPRGHRSGELSLDLVRSQKPKHGDQTGDYPEHHQGRSPSLGLHNVSNIPGKKINYLNID